MPGFPTMSKQPNILVFFPDALQAQVVQADSECKTPNFERLACGGVRFSRAHTVLPTCSPARASLMTGLLPHNHGVLQVEHCVDNDQSVLRTAHPHWAQRLCEAGYHTGYFGKWHIERTNRLEDFGWQVNGCNEAAAFRSAGQGKEGAEALLNDGSFVKYTTWPDGYNRVLHYGVTDVPTEERSFAVVTRRALSFIEQAAKGDRPWACGVSFPEPNAPLIAGRAAFEQYDVAALKLPENLRDKLVGAPGFYRRQQKILECLTDRQWRELRAVYYALVTELDQQFGSLLDLLERTGELSNTVVVVTSDHGRYLGSHGFDNHNFGAFEEAYRIPLIIAGPGMARGAQTNALVALHDLCPTLIELAGARPIEPIDARSFAPVLFDPAGQAAKFDTGYAEYHGTRFPIMQRVLWHGPWKFVFNGFDYDELYNLDEDPHELNNLIHDPARRDQVRTLMTMVWKFIKDTNDRALLETHYSAMRFAAIGPNIVES